MDHLRLIHFADLHLGIEAGGRIDPATGLNQRWVDVCRRFDELCQTCEKEEVHAVLFAGDAFKHQHPNPTLQSLFAERVRRLARAGAAVFLLVGNHDLPKMSKHSHPFSIYEALEVEGVVVGDSAQVYRLPLGPGAPAPVLQVAALPHFSRQQILMRHPDINIEEAVADRVKALTKATDFAAPSVFVGHCHVEQAELGAEGAPSFGVSDVQISLPSLTTKPAYPYYALGHIHRRQVVGQDPLVAYAGSLERTDFGEGEKVTVRSEGRVARKEAEPKGFYRINLKQDGNGWSVESAEFREVAARRFVTIRTGELDVTDPARDLGSRIDKARDSGVLLNDAFVRIAAILPSSERGRLTTGTVRDLIREAYEVRLALDTTDGPAVRDPRFARPMGEAEALASYLETRDDWDDDREELLRLGRELIAEVGGS